jgi:hypothetical protein
VRIDTRDRINAAKQQPSGCGHSVSESEQLLLDGVLPEERERSWWKGFVAGAVGGIAGVAAMNLYQRGVKPLLDRSNNGEDGRARRHDISLIGRQHRFQESSTAALGRIIHEKMTKTEPDDRTQKQLSNAVHWGYGITMGGIYGLVRGKRRNEDPIGGLGYGMALWIIGDELAVPLLGLAEGPRAYAKTLHAESLGAHIVYGIATAAVAQSVRRILDLARP